MEPKLIELEDLSPNDEPTIQIVRPGDMVKLAHVKVASEALDYIKSVKPQAGRTIILMLAVASSEHYGFNRNGDGWPERPLRVGPTEITAAETLPQHYKTFETDGNVFQHHVNKDPNKRIGEILKAFYNWKMHRVELLLSLINNLAESTVEDIENGKTPAGSMGCKVVKDICSICGHPAPNRSQYCDHAKYHLGEIQPDGRKVGVFNPSPKFFDISIVRRPALNIGFMMKKVAAPIEVISSAELGEKWEDDKYKAAQLRKLSVIEKAISSEMPLAKTDDGSIHGLSRFESMAHNAAENMPPIGDSDIKKMLAHRPAEVLSTLTSMGIILTTPEFLKYFIWKLEPEAQISEETLRRAVSIQKAVFDLLANNTKLLDDAHDSGFCDISEDKVNLKIAHEFAHLLEKRSQLGSYLYRNVMPDAFKTPTTKGKWDVLNVTDPQTGKQYQTTRGAAEKGQDWAVEHRIPELVGGGLLLGGAYKLLTHPKLRFLSPLAAIPGAMLAWRGAAGYPSVRAQTGEEITLPRTRLPFEPRGLAWQTRGGTELAEKRSSERPVMNEGSALITLIQDHLHTGAHGEKLARLINTEKWDEDSFDHIAQTLGNLIWKTKQ